MEASLVSTIQEANAALLAGGDLDAAEAYFTDDYLVHLTGRDMGGGPAGVREFVAALRRSFTDLRVDVEILLEGPDRVAWQRTITGEHSGPFRGFPATGRTIVWRDMLTSRFRDGRIAEDWAVSDLAEQLLIAPESRTHRTGGGHPRDRSSR